MSGTHASPLAQPRGARRATLAVVAGLLALAAVGAGCATSMTADELDGRLRAAGREVRGLRSPHVFPLYAATRMEAYTLLADARTESRERESLDLAQQFAVAKTRRLHMIVGGPYADLNRQVVWNALSYHEGVALPGLVIVYASPGEPDADLLALAKRKRVQLIHRPLD
ncbi:MAG: hypothetical protein KC560_17565 [Myxococcales bacterium]|nr:hypothetical protein [Myxococcales bacterium]